MQVRLRATLLLQDFVLGGGRYRDGNFCGPRIERRDKRLVFTRCGDAHILDVVSNDLGGVHAIGFPGQLPEPSPSGEGAGWAIGVALP